MNSEIGMIEVCGWSTGNRRSWSYTQEWSNDDGDYGLDVR
jgi:hypothetical protein